MVSVQGILLLIPRPMSNVEDLIQQIIDQQRSKGYSIADNITIKVVDAGNSLGDDAYLFASLKMNFSHLETEKENLLERTRKHDFQSSDGDKGEYYIIFDRKHILK